MISKETAQGTDKRWEGLFEREDNTAVWFKADFKLPGCLVRPLERPSKKGVGDPLPPQAIYESLAGIWRGTGPRY